MSVLHKVSGRHDGQQVADVVFLHGLGGDAFETWSHSKDSENSWLRWLGEDFPAIGVWSVRYAAAPSTWPRALGLFSERRRDAGHGMALPTRAGEVLDSMVQRGLGERPLFFICHSLGGLLAKQVLRMSSDALEPKSKKLFQSTRAVLFLATPHYGSDLAKQLDGFRTILGTTVTLQGLQAHDERLGELYDWYRNHAAAAGIQTATYFEDRPFKGITIVKRAFAHPGVGSNPVALDEDHCSIAKPRDRDSNTFVAAANLIRDYLLAPRKRPIETKAEGPTIPQVIVQLDGKALQGTAWPTPFEMPPAAEEFFGRKSEVSQLVTRLLAGKNTAVVGAAGMGKTALAARALAEVAGPDPTLGPFPDGIVFLDLYRLQGDAEQAWGELANKLAGVTFLERMLPKDRATNACMGRRLLVVIEGGEEASGTQGRPSIGDLLEVCSPQNRWLLLTRLKNQASVGQSVILRDALLPDDATDLLNAITKGSLNADVREKVLTLLEGHPLALTWAGNLLADIDEDPEKLVQDWARGGLPALSDPGRSEHTLEWLFSRSVRGLPLSAQEVLGVAGLLAHAPFSLEAIAAGLPDLERAAAEESLRLLVQCSFVRRSEEAQHWRFVHVLGYQFSRRRPPPGIQVTRCLGKWLREDFLTFLSGYDSDNSAAKAARALGHFSALLRGDHDKVLWEQLVEPALYDIADRLNALGRLGQTRLLLKAVEEWIS